MTFGEKLMNTRLALNLSQSELGDKVGVSERSIYSYEQAGAFPRKKVLQKLAGALRVSIAYLMDEDETDRYKILMRNCFSTTQKMSLD